MKRIALAIAALVAVAASVIPAHAQISQGVRVCNPDYPTRCQKPAADGSQPVTVSSITGTSDINLKQVNGATVNVGTGAAGTGTQRVTTSTDSSLATVGTVTTLTTLTNPVGVKGVDGSTITSASNLFPTVPYGAVTTTPPTYTTGTNNTLSLSIGGGLRVGTLPNTTAGGTIFNMPGVPALAQNPVDDSPTPMRTLTANMNRAANGGGILASGVVCLLDDTSPTTPTEDNATTCRLTTVHGIYVTQLPSPDSASAITPSVSTATEGSRVLKASAGNLYRISITTGGSAGYLMVFNATSAPADGAVTPAICRVIAANSSLEVNFSNMPSRFTTGITAVFSTTGCFTKTVSATAMFEGWTQ